ncbi:hypothetical protein B0H10DRAFT_2228904 [Mycena sp. CBHHK59/15]|nr:hypothetical protein B0H10DRAFT_2228904 [Mycena sp. CBHHK59/15]
MARLYTSRQRRACDVLKTFLQHHTTRATANYARTGFTQQDIAALEQPVPVADTLSIDMSSDSEPGDSSLSFSLISDLSIDKKSEIPPLSKIKKPQQVELLIAALTRWLARVEAGETPLMGKQVLADETIEEETIESDNEEEDACRGVVYSEPKATENPLFVDMGPACKLPHCQRKRKIAAGVPVPGKRQAANGPHLNLSVHQTKFGQK